MGLPAAATNCVIPVASGVITALLAPYGHQVVAGFGLGTRVESVAMVLFFALSAVMNPFAGQNAGAGRTARVQEALRVTAWFCAGFGALLAVILYLARAWIATRFTHDPGVLAAATMYLALVHAVAVSVARRLVVIVPVAWLGGRLFGAEGVFLGICFANVLVGVAGYVWVYAVTGQGRRVVKVAAVVAVAK